MRKNKEFENNESAISIRTTFTIHAKRQRLTNIGFSQNPNAHPPNEEQVSALLEEIRAVNARRDSNKPAARKRLNK